MLSSRIILRTTSHCRSSKYFFASFLSSSVSSSPRLSISSFFNLSNASLLSVFAAAGFGVSGKFYLLQKQLLFHSILHFAQVLYILFFPFTPTFSRNSCCAFICTANCIMCKLQCIYQIFFTAFLPSPSTIIRFFSVAAIIKSISAFSSSVRVGLTSISPSTLAIRTSQIISLMGISETANAAEAARAGQCIGHYFRIT